MEKEKQKGKRKRIGLQRVIREFTGDEVVDNSMPEEEISIDPNDISVFELPIDEAHLGIGAAIGLGSMMHHLACGEEDEE